MAMPTSMPKLISIWDLRIMTMHTITSDIPACRERRVSSPGYR